MTKNAININEILREDYKSKTNKFNGKYNKTTMFCLPMVNLSISGKAIAKFLKSAYLDDLSFQHEIERPLFLLMSVRSFSDKTWTELYKILTKDPFYKDLFITDYFVGMDGDHALFMIVMQVPKRWEDDFDLFKTSQYSKMSSDYKSKFPQYDSYGESKEWGILHKSANQKDQIARLFINPSTTTTEQAIRFRKEIDTWPEIFDSVNEAEEIYKWTNATTNINSTATISSKRANCGA